MGSIGLFFARACSLLIQLAVASEQSQVNRLGELLASLLLRTLGVFRF
jgi:hypothetical protein